jgi:hypothetical protein
MLVSFPGGSGETPPGGGRFHERRKAGRGSRAKGGVMAIRYDEVLSWGPGSVLNVERRARRLRGR